VKTTSKQIRNLIALVALVTLLQPLATALAQGSLTPPPGVPAPVMKTLDQIEPRIPVGPDTTPGGPLVLYRITQPGSYYLTDNLQGVSNKYGITISASDVTLDLNGFEVVGVPESYSGINAEGFSRVRVRNGTVRNWKFQAVYLTAAGCLVEQVTATGNGGHGIAVDEGTVLDCLARNNGSHGVVAAIAKRVIASGNLYGINARQIADSQASNNQMDGIINAAVVTGSLAENNQRHGFASCSLVQACTANNNGSDGIQVSSGGQVIDCTSRNNEQHGILLSGNARAKGNQCFSNGQSGYGHGIHVTNYRNTVSDNVCSLNKRGLVVTGERNRIEDNNLTENETIGLFVTGQYNLIIRNTARNPAAGAVNWNIAAGNRGGSYVAPSQNAAINGATGGPGSGTTDPFANLSF
jgi:parallel beta-helix repeat protein